MTFIRAYWRRRGWLAWQIAALGRFEFESGFPDLNEMMGVRSPPIVVKPGDNVRAMKLHAAVAAQRCGGVAAKG